MTKDSPIEVRRTEASIAEYEIATDTILLWRWDYETVKFWYHRPGETYLQTVVRVIAHEELHRILNRLCDEYTTFLYDNICECDISGLV